jgi:hypothetical protein
MSHEPLSDAYKKAYDAVMKDLRAFEFAPMPFPFYEGIPPKPTGFSVAELLGLYVPKDDDPYVLDKDTQLFLPRDYDRYAYYPSSSSFLNALMPPPPSPCCYPRSWPNYMPWSWLIDDEPKTVVPPKPEKVKQDTCVVGYRNWLLLFVGEQQVLLRSTAVRHYVWPPGEAAKGESPTGNGLYAYTTLKRARANAYGTDVLGHVKLWGTVYEHSDGVFRGGRGYPTKLLVHKDVKNAKNVAQMLARAYGCDVVVGYDD